jgi:uncharacterized membrane protein YdjX (TVP38/TMEM64 family)
VIGSGGAKPSLLAVRTLKWVAAAAGTVCLALVVWSAWDHQAVMRWIERARPLPFFSLLALLPVFGFPVSPLFVLAGASFGMRIGIVGSLLALAANLTACYWIARWMRPVIESLLRRFNFRLPDITKTDRSPTRFALAVKLAPGLPAFVKNYALGLTGIPFVIYFTLSMLITGAYAVLLVVLGESLLEHRIDRTVWVALVVVGLGLIAWLRFRSRRNQGKRVPVSS